MKFLLVIVSVYLFVLAYMFVFQRDFMYMPDTDTPLKPAGAEVLEIPTFDNLTLRSWYFEGSDTHKPVIVFFHGNTGNISHRFYKAEPLLNEGYGVLLVEYRGYGGNLGYPSEDNFYNDARLHINHLINTIGIDEHKIVLYGESIGSGVATQMAVEYNVLGLILEVPFDSMLNMAKRIYWYLPVNILLKDRFENIRKISSVQAPILIMHGHKDEVIPYHACEKLFNAANQPKKIVSFPQGKHNNLYDFKAEKFVIDFLSGITTQKTHNKTSTIE